MRQRYKLLLLAGAIIVLGGLTYWLATYEEKDINLVFVKNTPSNNVVSVTLTHKNTAFTVTRERTGFTTTNFKGIDIATDITVCNALFESIAKVSYSEILSDTLDNKGDFGLDTPSISVTATLKDNTSYTLYIGDNFFTGTGICFYLSDNNKIFGTSDTASFHMFSYEEENFFDQVLFPQTKGSSITDLTAVSWNRGNTKYNLVATQKNNETRYFLQSPIALELDTADTKDMLYPLLQLSATTIYKPKLSQKEKTDLGFTGNKVSFIIKGRSHTFEVGKKTTLGYYVLAPNGVCYIVPTTSLKFIEHQFG